LSSISVVIPVLNEAASLEQLFQELDSAIGNLVAPTGDQGLELQVIFIDDGSTDRSWDTIAQLAARDPRVTGIRLRRNFGKAAALSAGFHEATGALVVMMDADLQDSPAEIPKLIARLEDGLDVVSGWKQTRRDPWHKVWPSRLFNWAVSWLTGVKLHDHNCGLKCFRREVIHEVRLYGELHRFLPVLAAARGFRVGEVPVAHRARAHGYSKYGLWRLPKGLLDLMTVTFLTRFGHRPQHWLGMAGLISFLFGVAGMGYLALIWLTSRLPGSEPVHLHQTAALYYSLVALLIGSQLLAIGLVAELLTAIFIRNADTYSIAEQTPPIDSPCKHAAENSAVSSTEQGTT
jgi:glycosyltransferase involved in cell wall biosynthesis